MNLRRHVLAVATLATALVAGSLQATGAHADPPPVDPAVRAEQHLRDDVTGRLLLDRTDGGRLFVGSAAHTEVANPNVDKSDSVRAAARAHLDRYGAALGAAHDSSFVQRSVDRTDSGVDVVRFAQTVAGVPVLGGDVVLGLGPDRQLRSLTSDVAPSAEVTDATVDPATAEQTALGLVRRADRRANLTVDDLGRWILDPAVAGLDLPGGARTVRRLEVGDGAGIRELVLVDDHTGQVVLRTSLIENLDRVVCDDANTPSAEPPCTSGFARTEGGADSVVADVNAAYDFSQEVSTFYSDIAGIDLTNVLGIDVNGTKKLASTVRYCTLSDACPYENAFWNGVQMFYGQGYAVADDVVGHEMTHGVVDQYSKLFYWGQSGAINESLADTIGEIIDHRNGADSDGSWNLGEDLPGGALRSMKDPTTSFQGQPGQPDRMTSALYAADDADYSDAAGVHTNSGVGNKTAYLISHGDTFNGQAITGIDTGDPSLTKTARLYVNVIESLPSGADYATLAHVLDQRCADLLTAGTAGFTAANCTSVHQAGLATELATNPPNAPHATDADTTCPAGTAKRVLLDSESDPTNKFAPFSTGWARESAAGSSNATSGTDSWYAADPGGATPSSTWIKTNPLRSASSIALPAGQQSFLSFENWYAFDYDASGYYDGGTVEVGLDGGVPMFGSTNSATWVNGPNHRLASGYGNTASGQPAYSGDSHGWSVSRLDLTPDAGHTVQPQFTMRSDNQFGFVGWYLDDITVYTCDVIPSAPQVTAVNGSYRAVTLSWSPPSENVAALDHYWIRAFGVALVSVPGTSTSGQLTRLGTCGLYCDVQVISVAKTGGATASRTLRVWFGSPSLASKRIGTRLKLHGLLWGGRRLPDKPLTIQRKTASGWVVVATVRTRSDGTFVKWIRHRKRAIYRAIYFGGPNYIGTTSPQSRG